MSKKQGESVKVQTSRHAKVDKSKSKSQHKEQGKPAPSQLVSNGGDAFAYGLSKALSDIESKKGSTAAFLGVETKTLDVTAHEKDRSKLPTKKG